MSLETWKAEFLPVYAYECEKKDAVAHSLLKWSGLRPSALRRHGVSFMGEAYIGDIGDEDEAYKWLRIDADNCALCHWHLDDYESVDECRTCPGYRANGRVCWGAYFKFSKTGETAPMIRWLKKIA
jgi:hypothetical protein